MHLIPRHFYARNNTSQAYSMFTAVTMKSHTIYVFDIDIQGQMFFSLFDIHDLGNIKIVTVSISCLQPDIREVIYMYSNWILQSLVIKFGFYEIEITDLLNAKIDTHSP